MLASKKFFLNYCSTDGKTHHARMQKRCNRNKIVHFKQSSVLLSIPLKHLNLWRTHYTGTNGHLELCMRYYLNAGKSGTNMSRKG